MDGKILVWVGSTFIFHGNSIRASQRHLCHPNLRYSPEKNKNITHGHMGEDILMYFARFRGSFPYISPVGDFKVSPHKNCWDDLKRTEKKPLPFVFLLSISFNSHFRYIGAPYHIPIGSMYGIYANIGGILMVNVAIYSIHGSYGI